MRALDVGHCPGVKVEPLLAEDGVPAPADKLVNHYQGPNREMIDFGVHKSLRIIQVSEHRLQGDSGSDRAQRTASPLSEEERIEVRVSSMLATQMAQPSPSPRPCEFYLAPRALFQPSLGQSAPGIRLPE